MKIKFAKSKDKKEFLQIQKEAFPNLNTLKQAKYFDLKLKNKEIFMAFEGSETAGHLCFGRHTSCPPLAKSVFIEELAVHKKSQGIGIGGALIEHLAKFCKQNKIKVILTATSDHNQNPAIHFYEKLGFKRVGSLKEIDPDSEYEHGQIFFGLVLK